MGGHVRILTGNLCNGAADERELAELVRSTGVDLVAVQELGHAQAEALAEVLPYGRLEPASDYTGMGIALRRPASLARVPLVYRDARVAQLDPEAWPELPRPIEIINVHIASPLILPIWSQPVRRHRQVSGVLDYIGLTPERSRAVVGDFNATPMWPVYWRMAARLRDLALAHARERKTRPRRTWPRWRGGVRFLRIDHCFAQGLTAHDLQVVELPGSDHFGLLIDLAVD